MDPKNKEQLNPAEKDIGEKVEFERLLKAEKTPEPGSEETSESPDLEDIKDQEETSRGGEGFYRPSPSGAVGGKAKISGFLKKRGPLGIIIAIVLGGGIGITTLFSPAILLVQLKEVMASKFNYQLASMDRRTQQMIISKTEKATKGRCGTVVSIRCRYSTMSEKQVAKFKAAGIEVKSDGESILGRTKPKAFVYDGREITPSEFKKVLIEDANFRNAVKRAYNPKFAGFADKTWSKVRAKFGFSERAPPKAKDAEERKKSLHETSKKSADAAMQTAEEGKSHPLCKTNPCTAEEAADVNSAIEKVKASAGKGGFSQIGEGIRSIKGLSSTLSITGYLEYACQAYGALRLTSLAAKTIRALQLANYAMTFFTVADMIKAGDATPEDVSQLGTILTDVSQSYDGNAIPRGTATDSFGYHYAAYGDNPQMNEYVSMFVAGGGLTGALTTLSHVIDEILGDRESARKTCGTLANPFVQFGTLILGLVFTLIPGVGQGKLIAQVATGIALSVALAILPGILADIIAGNVTENIQGEDSGNAITSGTGTLLGTVANNGGNAPMSKNQALAYTRLQDQIAQSYLKDEALALSPFDASNKYTFMGSIANTLMPYYSSQAFSVRSAFGSSLSLLGLSARNLLPQASAVSMANQEASLDICQDYDYRDIGIATDPFCNPIFGVPSEYLDADPIEVVDYLQANGYYSEGEDPQITQKYTDFINTCIDRAEPFGYNDVNDPNSIPDGKDCVIDSKLKAYAYINAIDERVDGGMEGYDITTSSSSTTPGEGVVTNLGNFVFPLATTQSVIKQGGWCWQDSDMTCHGTEDIKYYASDIFAPTDTVVVAATDGVVGSISYSPDKGHMINIKGNDCPDGTQTCKGQGTLVWYGHLKNGSVKVRQGQEITAGTQIAVVGTRAEATDTPTHLHIDFSDRKNQSRPPCSRTDTGGCAEAGFINVQKYLHDAFLKLPQ